MSTGIGQKDDHRRQGRTAVGAAKRRDNLPAPLHHDRAASDHRGYVAADFRAHCGKFRAGEGRLREEGIEAYQDRRRVCAASAEAAAEGDALYNANAECRMQNAEWGFTV